MKPVRKLIFIAAALAGALMTSNARADDPNLKGPTAFLRALHGVSGSDKVDVYIDGQKKLNDVEFAHVTKYIRLPSGTHTFRIVRNSNNQTLWTGTRVLRTGDFYTLGVYGTRKKAEPFLANDSSGNPGRMQSRLTLYQFSPGSPPLDVYGYTKTGRVFHFYNDVHYGQIKPANTRLVPMEIRIASGGRVIKTERNFAPQAGRHYAAYVLGESGKNFAFMVDKVASQ
jgi:hypothetical protein